MNGHNVTLTSFIVMICNVFYKLARRYGGNFFCRVLIRLGTITSWLRGRA